MIYGIGIDIEEKSRFKKHLNDNSFLNLICSSNELSKNKNIPIERFLPISFSCKEALFKSLGKSWTNSEIDWKDFFLVFEISNNKVEIKNYELYGEAEKISRNYNLIFNFYISEYEEYNICKIIANQLK
jgi:phosphopantetheine--protein transferase-like protein